MAQLASLVCKQETESLLTGECSVCSISLCGRDEKKISTVIKDAFTFSQEVWELRVTPINEAQKLDSMGLFSAFHAMWSTKQYDIEKYLTLLIHHMGNQQSFMREGCYMLC